MAQFIGYLKGTKGEASRLGDKKNGLSASVNGWNIGVKVYASTGSDGKDTIVVYKTGGSNGDGSSEKLAEIKEG